MCTVVFIPGKKEIYFASLRDEAKNRPSAHSPILYQSEKRQYLAPKDGLAGGTWIGLNDLRNVIILLNGGFEKHIVVGPYSKSRGLIVNELLRSPMPVADWLLMDLTNIEPFTLIIYSEGNLFRLTWDGDHKFRELMDTSIPHIWSSSTLYDLTARKIREERFSGWLSLQPNINAESLLTFFQTFTEAESGFFINRQNGISTLSFSFIELNEFDTASFQYHDLTTSKVAISELPLVISNTECLIVNNL